MEYEREQEEAAAQEAAHIGGDRDDELDYIELDSRPAGISAEAWRRGRGGRRRRVRGLRGSRGRAHRASRERPRPIPDWPDAGEYDEEARALDAEYGEADEEYTSEDEPGGTRVIAGANAPPTTPLGVV
jgi:hypothetical protein